MINFLTKNPAGKIVKFLGGAATGGALVPIIQGLLTTIGSASLEKLSRNLGAGGKKEDIDVEDRYGWAKESIKEAKDILGEGEENIISGSKAGMNVLTNLISSLTPKLGMKDGKMAINPAEVSLEKGEGLKEFFLGSELPDSPTMSMADFTKEFGERPSTPTVPIPFEDEFAGDAFTPSLQSFVDEYEKKFGEKAYSSEWNVPFLGKRPIISDPDIAKMYKDYKRGLDFRDGGKVPTISEYFSQKGVSMSGSKKQSLRDKLGLK
jgi:hypothetical protein